MLFENILAQDYAHVLVPVVLVVVVIVVIVVVATVVIVHVADNVNHSI